LKGLDAPILDLLGHCQESLLNVCSVLRRGLKEWDVQLISEFLRDPVSVAPNAQYTAPTNLCNAILNDLLAGQIGLVPNEKFIHAFGGITVDLLEPLLDVGEGVWDEKLGG